jgi:protein-disulfide isomerase
MRVTKQILVPLLIFGYMLFASASASASECVGPDSAKSAEIVSYLIKKYQIASSTNLVLANSAKANDSCFWKVEYVTASPKQTYVLFVSLVEMRAKNDALSKDLLAGANAGMGAAGAPVTIVEFSDFECPFCKRMTDVLEKEVLPKEAGRVRLVFRNFPLSMHPWAKQAAEIAECAALQKPEAFWAMHDYFFENQGSLTPANVQQQLTAFAATRKDLNQTQFAACVDHELGLGPVMQDQKLGDRLGIHGTPSLFVNGVRFDGFRSAEEMMQIVEQAARGDLVAPPAKTVPVSSNGGLANAQ